MTEERITETRDADGNTHTNTTVIHESGERRGGGGLLLIVVLIIAVVAGLFLFGQFGAAESAKDAAVADAARDVGDAAQQVGDAARDAADEIAR